MSQILISEFNVDAVVNTGVAGALNEALDVYDIVISTDAIQHDFDTTVFGDKKVLYLEWIIRYLKQMKN